MKKIAGLWIDHRKAVIAVVSDEGEEIKTIESIVEKHPGVHSTTPYESQKVQADDSREREFTGHLRGYYDETIAAVRGADLILIFGPGEAKGELKKRLEKDKVDARVVSVEAADKMSDRQIVSKVREYSHREAQAAGNPVLLAQ